MGRSRRGGREHQAPGTNDLFLDTPEEEGGPPVLLPTILVAVGAHRSSLPVGNDRNPVASHPEVDEEVLRGVGPPVAQTEVVLLAAALIAVPLNREFDLGVGLEEVGVCRQGLLSVRSDVGLIKVKVRILDLGEEFLLRGYPGGRRWRRRRWGRWNRHGDAGRSGLRPSRAFRCDGVSCRIFRLRRRGALCLDGADSGLQIEVGGVFGSPSQSNGPSLFDGAGLGRQRDCWRRWRWGGRWRRGGGGHPFLAPALQDNPPHKTPEKMETGVFFSPSL